MNGFFGIIGEVEGAGRVQAEGCAGRMISDGGEFLKF